MSEVLVTGGAGFIGSHLVDRLMKNGNKVTVYDNLSLGKEKNISQHLSNSNFKFVEADLLDFEKLKGEIKNQEMVFHLASNSDIKRGMENTDTDLKQGTIATYNVLEAMRLNKVRKIVFSSTSAVYGEAEKIPTPEDYGPLLPISLYGASKLAAEGLITAFCKNYNMQSWIFRFANIVGTRLTHGAIFDFIKKLGKNPDELEILGDGKQSKSYLHIEELVDAMLYVIKKSNGEVNIFNLGCTDRISISEIAKILVKEMGLSPRFKFSGGKRGWKGDIPLMTLSVKKISKFGWKSKLNSRKGVEKAVKEICKR